MTTTIYLVTGSTGEYSHRTDWTVKAFASEEKAKKMVAALAAWCDERGCGENPGTYEQRAAACNHPLDRFFSCDYTGTRYTYKPVELDSEVSP